MELQMELRMELWMKLPFGQKRLMDIVGSIAMSTLLYSTICMRIDKIKIEMQLKLPAAVDECGGCAEQGGARTVCIQCIHCIHIHAFGGMLNTLT